MEAPHDGLRAGVVGLGTIGGGLAISLARRGRVPAVYDVRPEAARGLPGVPDPLASPAEVARVSDVVFVAVVDAEQATEVVTGPEGILAAAHPDLVVVVMATIAVSVVRELARTCALHGVRVLDCGVTPGSKAAENGMVAVLGGPDDVVARVKPVFDDFAKQVVHCGPLGAGMATKIARNVVTYGSWRATHEAVELVAAAGVDPARLVEVVEASDPDGAALLTLQHLRMAERTRAELDAAGTVRMMDKDLDAAQQLASELGIAVPLIDVTRAEASDTLAWLDRDGDEHTK